MEVQGSTELLSGHGSVAQESKDAQFHGGQEHLRGPKAKADFQYPLAITCGGASAGSSWRRRHGLGSESSGSAGMARRFSWIALRLKRFISPPSSRRSTTKGRRYACGYKITSRRFLTDTTIERGQIEGVPSCALVMLCRRLDQPHTQFLQAPDGTLVSVLESGFGPSVADTRHRIPLCSRTSTRGANTT